MKQITIKEARALPGDWRWSWDGDFSDATLDEALLDARTGNKLTAWKPMAKPTAEQCAADIEEAIELWTTDGDAWWALTAFCNGEPDGSQLVERDTFRAGLRALLDAELAKITVLAYEEAGVFVVVPETQEGNR